MKISILQLSDIHFKNGENFVLKKTNKIFEAIKNEIDCSKYLFIVFTGDIAFSGQESEYKQAKEFIEILKTNIKTYNEEISIEFIFTAGNHDCNFRNTNEIRDLIIDTVVESPAKITDQFVNQCLEVQTEYKNFVEEYDSKDNINSDISNNIFTRYEYILGDHEIAFNSYNLAWVSQKKESQANIIYPVNMISHDKLSSDSASLTFSLFHHPLHWLEHNNMRTFKELINTTSDIVLTGHEHTYDAVKVSEIHTSDFIEYIEAGVLQDSHNENNSSFNLLHIDLETNKQDILEFNWKEGIYQKENDHKNILLPMNKKSMFQLKPHYKNQINTLQLKITHPTKENMSLEDIYIYPDLKVLNKSKQDKNIFLEMSSEKFKSIDNIEHTIIYGDQTSGKTSLSRILQLKFKRDGLVPVIIMGNDIKSNDFNSDRIKRVILKCFKNQYENDQTIIANYEQLDKDKIVLLFDDLQDSKLNSEHLAEFINNVKELQYSNLLFFAHEDLQLEATTEGRLAKALIDFKHFKILEFGHKLREVLIKQWIALGQESTLDKKELLFKTREKAESINTTVGYNIVPSYPIYLLTLLQAMEANESNSLSKSAYGHYYEFLIMKYLNAKAPMQPKDIHTVFTYTSTLAFECLEKKRYSFSREDLLDFDIRYRNKKRFSPSFNINDKLVESHILSVYEDEYKFSHDYIYYFFVAKYLSDNITNNEVKDIVIKMCARLYRSEFANIIMFLIYHSPQSFILDTIIQEAKNVFKNVEEFTFHVDELRNINASIISEKLKLEDRTLEESRSLELEEKENKSKLTRLQKKNDREDADYDEEIQELNQFSTLNLAFKQMEILGEIIKNYAGSLDGNVKYDLIKETYGLGLRSLKSIIEFFEDNHELLAAEIREVIEKKQQVTSDKINETVANMIFGMSSAISSGIVKKIAKAVASKELVDIYMDILKEEPDNVSMQLISHAIQLDFRNGLKIPSIDNTHKDLVKHHNRLPDSVLKKMVLEHIYMFDVDYKKKQAICAKLDIDSESSKKEMLKHSKK